MAVPSTSHDPVRLADPDPAWAARAAAACDRLRVVGGEALVAVEHIGSTAVPGLIAKPILDLLAGVRDLDAIPDLSARLVADGWEAFGEHGIPGRFFFQRRAAGVTTAHLHLVLHGGDHWRAHRAFRDALRRDADLAAAYAGLKRDLAARFTDDRGTTDREAYTRGKNEFVRRVLSDATSPAAAHPDPAIRWDARYRDRIAKYPGPGEPHPFLLAVADRLPTAGTALDIAAGLGRNSVWLAERGLRVTAVDVSAVACARLAAQARARGLPITPQRRDLEREPLPPGLFDVIVNTLYLQRDLAPAIEERLAPGGWLVFSTMIEGRSGPPPLRPGFLLQRGELPGLFPGLEVVRFQEEPPDAPRPEAALLARKPLGGGPDRP